MTKHRSIQRILRVVRNLLALLLLCALSLFLLLSLYGVPRSVLDAVEQRFSRRSVSIELGSARYAPGKGILLKDFILSRKGVADAPMLTASSGVVDISFRKLIRGEILIQSLHIDSGKIHTPMFRRPRNAPVPQPRQRRVEHPWIDIPLTATHFEVTGIHTDQAKGLLRIGPNQIELINTTAAGRDSRGHASVELKVDTFLKHVNVKIRGEVDPEDIVPLLKEIHIDTAATIVDSLERGSHPSPFELDIDVQKKQPSRRIDIRFRLEDGTYNSVPAQMIDCELAITGSNRWNTTELTRCDVTRPEGTANVSLAFDHATRMLDFAMTSSASALALVDAIPQVPLDPIRHLTFSTPPKISASGTLCMTNHALDELYIKASASDVGYASAQVDTMTFSASCLGQRAHIPDLRITAYGGTITGALSVAVSPKRRQPTGFTANIRASEIHFGEFLLRACNITNSFGGILSGAIDLKGAADARHTDTLQGTAHVRVQNGELFRLPIFAGLTSIMADIIPGLDFLLCQSNAKLDLIIRDNAAHAESMILEGDVFSLKGHGHYDFTNHLDLSIQLRLLNPDSLPGKVLALITFPLTKLFEFRVEGNPREAAWYPQNFHWARSEKPSPDGTQMKKEVLVFE